MAGDARRNIFFSALNIFFELFESEQKQKLQITKSPYLWIISALVASNWSQITFFILAYVLTSISEGFWPNFDQINISPDRRPFSS